MAQWIMRVNLTLCVMYMLAHSVIKVLYLQVVKGNVKKHLKACKFNTLFMIIYSV